MIDNANIGGSSENAKQIIKRMIRNSLKGRCKDVISIYASKETGSKFSTSKTKLISLKY